MKKLNYIIGIHSFFIFLFTFQLSMSQVSQEWVRRFNAPGNGVDMATSIAVDGLGNIFVTGGSHTGSGYDNATIKYNSAGEEQWVRRINGTNNVYWDVWVITADRSGNSYVTGGSQNFFITVKYDPAGNSLWTASYIDTGGGAGKATAIALDSSGNVYITGTSIGNGSFSDYATIKYNSNGIQQWVARFNGVGNYTDIPWSITTDTLGNVYVTGKSYTDFSNNDLATLKYNSNGIMQWFATYSGSPFSDDSKNSIIADNSGNVYVTGTSRGSTTGNDFATIKYDSLGAQLWASRYNGESNTNDNASSIALDDSGNIYVTGGSYTGISGKYITVKYSSDGIQQWVSKYAGTGNWNSKASSIALDHSGNIYVTGESGDNFSVSDFATIKYNPEGDSIWVKRYNGPLNTNEGSKAIAIDNIGNVYVTGPSAGNGTDWDYATVKYSQSTGINQVSSEIPQQFILSQNFPNPFNPTTNIEFTISQFGPPRRIGISSAAGGLGLVTLKIYDVMGREVQTLVNERLPPGKYNYQFSIVNYQLPSGVYFYRLSATGGAGEFTDTKRMMLIK